jgi:hypothetical protein
LHLIAGKEVGHLKKPEYRRIKNSKQATHFGREEINYRSLTII